MARVFISYRREDTRLVAARRVTRLKDGLRWLGGPAETTTTITVQPPIVG